jgi:hypothetical protein
MSSRARATQSRRPESKTDVRTAGRGATPPLPGGTGLQSLYSCRITSARGQRPVQQPQQRLRTIRSILAASQSLKSCQATIRNWCSISIPRKPMEPNAATVPLRRVRRTPLLFKTARSWWFSTPAASLQTFASTVLAVLVRCRSGLEAAIRDQRADQKAESLVRRVGVHSVRHGQRQDHGDAGEVPSNATLHKKLSPFPKNASHRFLVKFRSSK